MPTPTAIASRTSIAATIPAIAGLLNLENTGVELSAVTAVCAAAAEFASTPATDVFSPSIEIAVVNSPLAAESVTAAENIAVLIVLAAMLLLDDAGMSTAEVDVTACCQVLSFCVGVVGVAFQVSSCGEGEGVHGVDVEAGACHVSFVSAAGDGVGDGVHACCCWDVGELAGDPGADTDCA